jgi:HK97 family phage prohead protease
MKINFPMTITAADVESRTLTGKIVTWGEEGNTSAGRTVFAPNSIEFNKNIKLLLEHETTKPIGKMLAAEVTDTGIEAKFKVANTQSGSDSLVEAAEGLRDGFSVGIKLNEWTNENGVMVITSSKLIEVSLVTEPAIQSARVSEIAASQEEVSEEATVSEDQPTIEGEQVSENTVPAPAAETVEAAQSEVKASAPMFATPRVNLNVSAGQFALAQLRAQQGDSDARDLVAALDIATVSENTGMVPPNYLKDIIGIIDSSRPFVDSIERAALPASGMKIFTPKLGARATVAITAEGNEYDSTDTAVTFQEDTIVKFAGANVINQELVDRSDPSFVDLLLRELAESYARKTDAYAATIAADAAVGSTAATVYGAIGKGIADSFSIMRRTPDNLLVMPSGAIDDIDFAGLLGAVDGDDRPLFAAAAPSNAAGLISQGSTAGTVAGLKLVVDPNFVGETGGNKYALVYPTAAMRFHESGTIQIRANIVANGRIEIGVYGYVAVVNRYPTAFRAIYVTP